MLHDVVLLSLPIEEDALKCDVTLGPNMSWMSYVGSIFGSMPEAS